MSEIIDTTRRKLIQFGIVAGITLITRKALFADSLTDLILDANQNQILAVRLWPSSVYTRLTLEAEHAVRARCITLESPQRVQLDIYGVTLNAVLSNLEGKILSDDPIVSNIKITQAAPESVRIEISLKQNIRLQTQSIVPVNIDQVNYKYRYVLDMYPKQDVDPDAGLSDDLLALLQLQSDSTPQASAPVDPGLDTRVRRDGVLEAPATIDAALLSVPVADSFKQQRVRMATLPSKKIMVMLDPGHGGEDPGAIGPTGTKEKHVVLDISKYLCDMINATDYMCAKLTRTDDVFIPLGTRVAIARRAKADLFMSIHADAFTTPEAKGSSVFILSDSGASSSFARWLAKTQNASDLIGGMSFHAKDKMVNRMLLDMTQTWTRHKSDKFGQLLLSNLSHIGKLHSRYVEKAAFAVLKAPDIPSVLVETAFISNPDEESLLKTADFRHKVATAIFNGISNFVT